MDEVERDRAKRIVYGILYGMGARSLSEILNGKRRMRFFLLLRRVMKCTLVERAEAEEWIGTFLEKFPKTAQFLKTTAQAAHEQGFIRTLLNRRRSSCPLRTSKETLELNAIPVQAISYDPVRGLCPQGGTTGGKFGDPGHRRRPCEACYARSRPRDHCGRTPRAIGIRIIPFPPPRLSESLSLFLDDITKRGVRRGRDARRVSV